MMTAVSQTKLFFHLRELGRLQQPPYPMKMSPLGVTRDYRAPPALRVPQDHRVREENQEMEVLEM